MQVSSDDYEEATRQWFRAVFSFIRGVIWTQKKRGEIRREIEGVCRLIVIHGSDRIILFFCIIALITIVSFGDMCD